MSACPSGCQIPQWMIRLLHAHTATAQSCFPEWGQRWRSWDSRCCGDIGAIHGPSLPPVSSPRRLQLQSLLETCCPGLHLPHGRSQTLQCFLSQLLWGSFSPPNPAATACRHLSFLGLVQLLVCPPHVYPSLSCKAICPGTSFVYTFWGLPGT